MLQGRAKATGHRLQPYSEDKTLKVLKMLPGPGGHGKLPDSPNRQLPSCLLQVSSSPGRQLVGWEAKPPRICLILYKEGGLCLSLPPR